MCEIHRSAVFIFNTEHVSHLFLISLLLNLNKSMFAGRLQPSSLNLAFLHDFAVPQKIVQPFNDQCRSQIETSQLICPANQLTGFYMRGTLVVKRLKTQRIKKQQSQKRNQKPVKLLRLSFLRKSEDLPEINYSRKKHHLRYLTGFWICLWKQRLKVWPNFAYMRECFWMKRRSFHWFFVSIYEKIFNKTLFSV